jgi:hypothetical protein
LGADSHDTKEHVPSAEIYPIAGRTIHKKFPAIPSIRQSDNHQKEQKAYSRQVADYNG